MISSTAYRDLDFNLTKTSTNDMTVLSTENTIKQSIKNLLLTHREENTKYELQYMGSRLNHLLSEKATRFTALQIRDEVVTTLTNYEPRIKTERVLVEFNSEQQYFIIQIYYKIISLSLNQSLTINLSVVQ